jgi:hypothetical protein
LVELIPSAHIKVANLSASLLWSRSYCFCTQSTVPWPSFPTIATTATDPDLLVTVKRGHGESGKGFMLRPFSQQRIWA